MTANLRANAEPEMCDKCIELDGKIEHYERIAGSISDQLTMIGSKNWWSKRRPKRRRFHPQQE
jgi:hypothetical protein